MKHLEKNRLLFGFLGLGSVIVFTTFANQVQQKLQEQQHYENSISSAEIGLKPVIPQNKLLFSEDFENNKPLKPFTFTDANAWQITEQDGNHALELHAKSKYSPPVRSPMNIALIKTTEFEDFVLEADLMQTGREYGHRDMCLFFGYQDPAHFYYVHLATKADPNAHNIFIVNSEPRRNIATTTTSGIEWGETAQWHKVKIVREVQTGSIKVYFDDMQTPIMQATDTTFGAGHIGFGSFDDTGQIDNIRIYGQKKQKKQAAGF